MDLRDLRVGYQHGALEEGEAGDDPIDLFLRWIGVAQSTAQILEPNAMTLATVAVDGRPSARMVLLKEVLDGDFVFYTNRESLKGEQLSANPRAALVFWWEPLERQVRIEGDVTLTTEQQTAEYFASRPRASRIGAWASHQSSQAVDRAAIERQYADADEAHPGEQIPVPPWWGGYRITPFTVEFWQGRHGRLHDRLRYTREGASWARVRLQP